MRGVIMSVEGRKAVLLTQGGDFKQIRNKGYSVGDKVRVSANYAARVGTIAAALAVFVIGGGASYFIPASYVSVDINPSFLMTLNVYDKVIDVEPLNGEAENILRSADVKGKNINDTVETLIDESERIGYINKDGGDVIVSVVRGIKTPSIEDRNVSDNVNLVIGESDKNELNEARDMGVSIAKSKAIHEYTEEFGGTVSANANKLGGMTIKQIQREIDGKKASGATPAPMSTAKPQINAVKPSDKTGNTANTGNNTDKTVNASSAAAAPAPTYGAAQMFSQTPPPTPDSGSGSRTAAKAETRKETPVPTMSVTNAPWTGERRAESAAPSPAAQPEASPKGIISQPEHRENSGQTAPKNDKNMGSAEAQEERRDIGTQEQKENSSKQNIDTESEKTQENSNQSRDVSRNSAQDINISENKQDDREEKDVENNNSAQGDGNTVADDPKQQGSKEDSANSRNGEQMDNGRQSSSEAPVKESMSAPSEGGSSSGGIPSGGGNTPSGDNSGVSSPSSGDSGSRGDAPSGSDGGGTPGGAPSGGEGGGPQGGAPSGGDGGGSQGGTPSGGDGGGSQGGTPSGGEPR